MMPSASLSSRHIAASAAPIERVLERVREETRSGGAAVEAAEGCVVAAAGGCIGGSGSWGAAGLIGCGGSWGVGCSCVTGGGGGGGGGGGTD